MPNTLTFQEQNEVRALLNNWAAVPAAITHPCPYCPAIVPGPAWLGPCYPCQLEADEEAERQARAEAEAYEREAWQYGDVRSRWETERD